MVFSMIRLLAILITFLNYLNLTSSLKCVIYRYKKKPVFQAHSFALNNSLIGFKIDFFLLTLATLPLFTQTTDTPHLWLTTAHRGHCKKKVYNSKTKNHLKN